MHTNMYGMYGMYTCIYILECKHICMECTVCIHVYTSIYWTVYNCANSKFSHSLKINQRGRKSQEVTAKHTI